MTKKIDLRGYSCPIPLLRTRDALAGCDDLTVIIDEPAARERAAMLVTVAMADDQPVSVLKRLGDLLLNNKAEKLLNAKHYY